MYEFNTQVEAKLALVDAWNDTRISDSEKTQLMLAYTRKDILELNEMARSIRQSLGELGEGHLIQTERGECIFAEGDQIYFLRNDRALGVKNGTLGTVIDIDDHSLKVAIHKEGQDNPYHVALSLDQYNDLDYGYAATIHKAQGVTVDQSFILTSQYLDRHATYVGMTRHSDNVELFWSKEEFQNYEGMVSALSREKSKEFSLDYPEQEFAAHRGIESAGWPIFESYPVELSSTQDGILDWRALRQDVESHHPELAQEFTQRVTENDESDLELQNKTEKDVPDRHADLFYGINVDLSKNEKESSLVRDIADDKEIEL